MFLPSASPRRCRPARADDSGVPVLGLLAALLLLICALGGGFVIWSYRQSLMAREEAELARVEAMQAEADARAARFQQALGGVELLPPPAEQLDDGQRPDAP